jgi:hypothetical protein
MVDTITLQEQVIRPVTLGVKPPSPQTMVSVMDLAVVVAVKAGDLAGNFTISIVMEDPKKNRVTLLKESPVVLKGGDGVNVKIRFGLPYNAPDGRYWFDVLWDSELLTRIPITLKHEKPEEVELQAAAPTH